MKIRPLLFSFSLLLCQLSVAQEAAPAAEAEPLDTSDYYLVEMMVFSYENPANAEEETWSKNLQLSYLQPLARLQPVDVFSIYPELQPQPDTQATDAASLTTATEPRPAASGDETPVATYIALPELDATQQQFGSLQKRIDGSSNHQVLWHKAWLQKLGGRDNAPGIIIEAGEKAAGQRWLGGSIRLYKERYLHLNTDLWLVQFAAETPAPASNEANDSFLNSNLYLTDAIAQTEELEEEQPAPPEAGETGWPPLPMLPYDEAVPVLNEAETDTAEVAGASQTAMPVEPAIERIVVMQQKRRMRSQERHYIDHPLFGLIIELRPHQQP